MALGQTNISTTAVGNAIGSTSRVTSTLCTYAGINKWSKYKPVRGTFPQSNGYYGYNLPTNWDYVCLNPPNSWTQFEKQIRSD